MTFILVRFTERNDPPGAATIRIYATIDPETNDAVTNYPFFTIVFPQVFPLDGRRLEYLLGERQRDAMFAEIHAILAIIPREFHIIDYTCYT
jgi:hypothetical protein